MVQIAKGKHAWTLGRLFRNVYPASVGSRSRIHPGITTRSATLGLSALRRLYPGIAWSLNDNQPDRPDALSQHKVGRDAKLDHDLLVVDRFGSGCRSFVYRLAFASTRG